MLCLLGKFFAQKDRIAESCSNLNHLPKGCGKDERPIQGCDIAEEPVMHVRFVLFAALCAVAYFGWVYLLDRI